MTLTSERHMRPAPHHAHSSPFCLQSVLLIHPSSYRNAKVYFILQVLPGKKKMEMHLMTASVDFHLA